MNQRESVIADYVEDSTKIRIPVEKLVKLVGGHFKLKRNGKDVASFETKHDALTAAKLLYTDEEYEVKPYLSSIKI